MTIEMMCCCGCPIWRDRPENEHQLLRKVGFGVEQSVWQIPFVAEYANASFERRKS